MIWYYVGWDQYGNQGGGCVDAETEREAIDKAQEKEGLEYTVDDVFNVEYQEKKK